MAPHSWEQKKKNQDRTTKHFLCRQQDLKELQKQQAELAFVLSLEIIDEIKWLFLLSWLWVSKAETSQEEPECPSLPVTSQLITARYRHFPPGSPLSKSLPWQRQAPKGQKGSLVVSPPNSPIREFKNMEGRRYLLPWGVKVPRSYGYLGRQWGRRIFVLP